MNKGIPQGDPLIIFRCKNRQCRYTFTPSIIMLAEKHIIFFECPVCASKYEAHYTQASVLIDQEAIMLLEHPRLTYLGTRIASS